jgi:glutathione S-transferase
VLTVHHLGKSQSERIVWLCEELAIDYELKRYDRDPGTMMAPPEYKALHPLGAAPVITDGDLVLAESGAIMEYIIARHGGGRLALAAEAPAYADYLYWFHFVNGTLQPSFGSQIILRWSGVADDSLSMRVMSQRLETAVSMVDVRLGQTPHLAGEQFSAADIMMVFTLTTMRYFAPFDLGPYQAILAYLQRVADRPAYRRAMAKADPDMPLLLT